jgi:hypothetical protein
MFSRIAGGQDVWRRAEITDPRQQGMFDRMAQRLGVTGGEITRDQFVTAMRQRLGQAGGPAPSGDAQATAPQAQATGFGGAWGNADAWAEESFRRLDQNGDGLLNADEIPEDLASERDRWDSNGDGFIDLVEYKAYFQARLQQRMADRAAAGFGPGAGFIAAVVEPAEEEERKATVYHAGKLPKELPGWFAQLDTDRDAQIGLYEWMAAGRPADEFRKMDRNNDGFLTVSEVLRHQTQAKETTGGTDLRRPGPQRGSSPSDR